MTRAVPTAARPTPAAVLRHAGVRRLVASEVVAGLGDGVFWVALVTLLTDASSATALLAAAAAARLGPRALASAPAGVLADRADRGRLLVRLDLVRAALMLLLVALALPAHPRVGLVLLVVLAVYSVAVPYRPALGAALADVVDEDELYVANALIGTVRQVMTFVGPLFGVAVLAWWSAPGAFALDALSFLVSAALVAGIPELRHAVSGRAAVGASWRVELGDGFRTVRAAPGVRTVLVLVFVMYAVRGAEIVLLVLVAQDQLGLRASAVGLLTGAIGLGALLALPVAGRVAATRRDGLATVCSVLTTALPLALLALVERVEVAVALLAAVGFGVVAFEVLSIVMIQRLTPPAQLGRAFGIAFTASNGGKLLGALTVPLLVRGLGLDATLVWLGAAVGLVTVAALPALVATSRRSRARQLQLGALVDVLDRVGLLAGSSVPTLERVAAALREEAVGPGTVVLRQGEPADDLFLIRSGDFDVLVDGRVINTMGPDTWFGEIGLLQRRARTATVVARSSAVLWRIPGEVFLQAVGKAAAPPAAMLESMGQRLRRSGHDA